MINFIRKCNKLRDICVQMEAVGDVDSSSFKHMGKSLGILASWRDGGHKTFVLSNELVNAFKYTDLPKSFTPSNVNVPFDNFMITADVPITSMHTDDFDIDLPNGFNTNFHGLIYSSKNSLLKYFGPDGEYGFLLSGVILDDSCGLLLHPIKGQNDYNSLNYFGSEKEMSAGELSTKKLFSGMFNVMFNSVMYISDRSVNMEETQERRSVKVKTGKGGRVRSEYILLKPPKRYKSFSNTTANGKKIDKRFVVRGHWTHQAYGVGRKLRRYQWIMPYWKGPELSEIISKPYKVD